MELYTLKQILKAIKFEQNERTGREAMNVHDWRFWVTNSGMIIGIIGSTVLNPQAISAGLILGVGGLFWDSYLERKEWSQK